MVGTSQRKTLQSRGEKPLRGNQKMPRARRRVDNARRRGSPLARCGLCEARLARPVAWLAARANTSIGRE